MMEEEKETSDLESLKEDYKELKEEHKLPDFDELNEDFHIEKLAETETDFLVREIRKFMSEKFSNYLRFVEAILNPVNASMFIFSMIKAIGPEEKETLTDIYKNLAKKEVELIELDIEFNEENEIKFIKESYELWKKIKKDLLGIIEVVKKNWDNKTETNGKNYFG
jgi:hypothetical protein